MRYVVAVGSAFLLAALTVSAGDVEGKMIVGKWKMMKGSDTITAEFTKEGKLTISHLDSGKELKMSGTYEIKKNKIAVTIEKEDKKQTKNGVIEKLTADTLIIQGDGEKDRMEFKRVKD